MRTMGESMWQILVDSTKRAMFVHDAQGVVQMVSAAATDEFPDLVPGVRFTEVDGFSDAETDPFEIVHFGVRWRWRSKRLGAQHLAWHGDVIDDTETWCDNCTRSMFLANVSRVLNGSLDRERTMRAIVQLAVPTLADCCAVVLPAPRGRLEWWRFTRSGDIARGKIGRYVLESVVDLDDALSAPDAGLTRTELVPGPRPEWLVPEDFGEIGDLLVAPMRDGEQAVGALLLANSAQRGELAADQFHMVSDYAVRAATALSRIEAYTTQAEAVAILETDLVPKPLPDLPGTALAAAYRPAQQPIRVGGDFYEVYPGEDGEDVLFMLGDVAGSGVEAATLVGRIEHSVTALRLVESQPARLLHLLNQAILGNSGNRFATMVLGSMTRTSDGRLSLVLASGGHLPPLLLRADGAVQEVAVPGTLVGVLPEPRFSETTVVLAPGEVCLLYSDGVTEARGGLDGQEQFGQWRLGEAVADAAGMSAAELTNHVERCLDDWLDGGEHDDIAILAIQAVADGEA